MNQANPEYVDINRQTELLGQIHEIDKESSQKFSDNEESAEFGNPNQTDKIKTFNPTIIQ